jgi:hypothetical protein
MQKTITFNRDTKDFDMFLDGAYVGSRARHLEAEVELDRLAYAAAQHDSDMAIPAQAEILAVCVEQRADAVRQHDDATVRQLDRVIVGVSCGAQLRWVLGDLHIGSVNNPGVIYILSCGRCPCPATKPCWHLKLLDILLEMQDTAAGDADMEADADEWAMQGEDGPIIHLQLYCDPPNEGPSLGDEEGDELPDRARAFGQRLCAARRPLLYAVAA